jgi:hypothetical protein
MEAAGRIEGWSAFQSSMLPAFPNSEILPILKIKIHLGFGDSFCQ